MKTLARSYVWWPGIDREKVVKSCASCQEHQNMPPKAPIHPCKPWSRLHINFAGPHLGMMYLILVDLFSKWVDVYPVKTANSTATIEKLRASFATHGVPEILVSDNASCFKSEEFGEFMKKNNIRHITSAPYHPSTNSLAERGVQTFKNSLGKMFLANNRNYSVQTLINSFLFSYHITLHTATRSTPVEL